MKQTKTRTKKVVAWLLAFVLLTALTPFNVFSANAGDFPEPGEALRRQDVLDTTGWGSLEMDGYEGLRRIALTRMERVNEFDRLEAIIVGDALEICWGVLIYANDHRTYAIHEIFADGERMTFFIDHSQGELVEMYVRFRSVVGSVDTRIYSFPVRADNSRGTPASQPLFPADMSVTSPNRLTRPLGEGSAADVLVFSPGGRVPSSTVSVERPDTIPTTPQAPIVHGQVQTNPNPPTVTPPVWEGTPPSEWARDSVERAGELGLLPDGFRNGFQRPTTRAEFTRIAVTLYEHHNGAVSGRRQFNDTNCSYVERAAYLNIVNGVGNGSFNPNANITRQEAAVMLANLSRAMGHPLPNSPTPADMIFADSVQISSWAATAIGQMYHSNIMTGTGNNMFSPLEHYAIQQAIHTIMAIHGLMGDSG
ncbi:S-layer homology domain-containing protein [Candidatus Saccharibacteria bacterium]|nr:S-layer homology domain-containing protein [Candidatus Saccharibacteria bacterium]